MNTATAQAQIVSIEAQIATLNYQVGIVQDHFRGAVAQNDLGAAKFGLGMLAGALVAASPEDDRYALNRSAIDASSAPVIEAVIDTFSWMSRRANELEEELQQNIRRIRYSAELDY
jgi:hypothetical protein